jgi:hypothetical protein
MCVFGLRGQTLGFCWFDIAVELKTQERNPLHSNPRDVVTREILVREPSYNKPAAAVVYKFTTHLSITCTLQSAGPTSRILANLAMPGNAHPNFQ